jgi:hypothetical protein
MMPRIGKTLLEGARTIYGELEYVHSVRAKSSPAVNAGGDWAVTICLPYPVSWGHPVTAAEPA